MMKRSMLIVFAMATLVSSVVMTDVARGQTDGENCLSLLFDYSTDYSGDAPLDVTFSTKTGLRRTLNSSSGKYFAVVPKTKDGDPNPDFDRLYALVMKGLETRTLSGICYTGVISIGKEVELTSVTMRIVRPTQPPRVQQVQICDAFGSCASIWGSRLSVNTQ